MHQYEEHGPTPLVWYEPFWSHRRRNVSFAQWIAAWIAGARGVAVVAMIVLASTGLVLALGEEYLVIALTAPTVTVVTWISISYLLTLVPRGIRIDTRRLLIVGLRRERFELNELDVAWIEAVDDRKRQLLMRFPAKTVVLGLPPKISESTLVSTLGDKMKRTA